jgi:hypothetical protein
VTGGGEAVGGRVDPLRIVLGHRLLSLGERLFDLLGFGVADLRAVILEGLFDVVDHRIGAIARFDGVALFAVVGRVRFGVARHLLDFVLGQA